MVKTIIPDNKEHWLELRASCLTSTEIAALFNCSPYTTAFELWHRKKNKEIVTLDPNVRMLWGSRLERSIAEGVAEDNGWKIRPMKEFMYDDVLKIGASFDFSIGEEEILEIKNVDNRVFREGWIVDGDNIEAPPHLEIQVQVQMMISGRKVAWIAALVGGNDVKLIKREPDVFVRGQILNKALLFWESIEKGNPPDPDFSRDLETISRLYGFAEPGKVMDARGNQEIGKLMADYHALGEAEKAAKMGKDAIKGRMLTLIGDHEKILGETFTISAGMVGPTRVEAYDRAGFRMFKPSWKKIK